jgi:uncharacterized protein involved in exopolysaccharide biosynthesis
MLGYQKLKRQLLPLLRGIPFIVGVFLLSLYAAKKVIDYTPNTYQSIAKIKLDDQKYGFSNNNLFSDFDVFSTENKIEAEAEILQSPLIVEKALDSLSFDVVIYRIGSFKNTMLYDNSPIQITYQAEDDQFFKNKLKLSIAGGQITVSELDSENSYGTTGFGEVLAVNHGSITLLQNDKIIGQGIDLDGDYEVKIFSKEGLIQDVISRLNITAVDKEIAVLRVVYTDEHPQKVADLVNALCSAYINDYVETKSAAAKQTEDFINQKLDEVGSQLTAAENDIESFKIENNVVNTLQETETGLREISKLNVSMINLEMNEKAILQLKTYLDSGTYFDETAIAFGFGDLLMTELVKKMKYWQDERRDLLLMYQPTNQKVMNVDAKIEEIKAYIVVAINQNLAEIATKRSEIEEVLALESKMFDSLPIREKNQNILERNFDILENVYNFLSQKKIEASIAGSAMHSFHRVIEKGKVPTEPISPNRTLIRFVFGLLGLIISIAIVYLRSLLRAKVKSKEDVEQNTNLSLLGVIRKKKTAEDTMSIALALDLKDRLPRSGVIAITSTLKGEGKSHFASAFKQTLQDLGVKTTIYSPNGNPHLQHLQDLKALEKEFDVVLIDCLPTASSISGVHFMKNATMSIYLLKADYTPNSMINHAELLVNEYEIKNVHLVLNGAHKAMNYSGNLIGSRFNHNQRNGILGRIKGYVQTYIMG